MSFCANVDATLNYGQDSNQEKYVKLWQRVSFFPFLWWKTSANVGKQVSRLNTSPLLVCWFSNLMPNLISISCLITYAFPNYRSGKQCSKGIGYYTQLVWQDTTHVGCGWSQFQYRGFPGYFENFLVCNYGPSANVWKQPVYDIANSTCNCPCIGCNPSTGLCPPNCKFAVWADWASW